VGFDVMYQKLESASKGAQVLFTPPVGVAKPQAFYTIQDQDNYMVRVRVHRDIVP
jgi:hypothetical protein